MKLLLCPECADVRKLAYNAVTYCECGKSYGMYKDNINAVIGGKAIPIALDSHELVKAIQHKPCRAYDSRNQFTGWVIAMPCPSVRKMRLK